MTEHFVTLFDGAFLPQALALRASLERHIPDYSLWVLCIDDLAHDVLSKLALPRVRLLRGAEMETADLRRVKTQRSRAEYCWTLTPFAPGFVFAADAAVKRVTYVDADLYLLKSPRPIFAEFEASGKHVLITEHAFAPEYDKSAANGIYCVQFMPFNRGGSDAVVQWWQERCIERCSAEGDDGTFGDQKYLDDWPDRFANSVHVLQHKEWTLAPWNATRFPCGDGVFYHFHGLRILPANRVSLGEHVLPPVLVEKVYEPYLRDLRDGIAALRRAGLEPIVQRQAPSPWAALKRFVGGLLSQRRRFTHRVRSL